MISLDITCLAQGVDNMVGVGDLEDQIGFLTSEMCEGRAPGSKGASVAAFWVVDHFKKANLMPVSDTYSKSFRFGDGKVGHNIMGMIPGSQRVPRDTYIIVMAHYDHLGILHDQIYPGADSNASGVASLVNIASMFNYMKTLGRTYSSNILFVALDAKEASMAGSEALYSLIGSARLKDPITKKLISVNKIRMVVDIDQIGSSLAPLRSGREDFIIMLGNETLAKNKQVTANFVNRNYGTNLELAFDYYGSERFTEMFYSRVTDLRPFVQAKIPAVLFTSGITMKTNKPDDTVETLKLDVLRKRIIFMFHWIENML
ncbi:MAG: M28 family peptidase [Bacteroidales bacterium]|nr:M28 family peptidase [Bacteroidales bacterium]